LREYDRTPFTDAELTTLSKIGTKPMLLELGRFYLDNNQPEKLPYLLGSWNVPDAQGLRARAAILSGRTSEGLALAENVLTRDVSQCDALLARSQGHLLLDKPSPAIVDLQLAVHECQQYVSASLALAEAFGKKGDDVGVRRAYDQSIDLNPQDTLITAGYTGWLIAKGRGANAVNMVKRLTRDAPALLSAWRLQRDVCTKTGDSDCASVATQGLARAQVNLGIDLFPGEKPPNGLFGRLRRQ
jgi:predicted Zn-dependent protease